MAKPTDKAPDIEDMLEKGRRERRMKDISKMTADEARIELEVKRQYIAKINEVIRQLNSTELADVKMELWKVLNALLEASMMEIQ